MNPGRNEGQGNRELPFQLAGLALHGLYQLFKIVTSRV